MPHLCWNTSNKKEKLIKIAKENGFCITADNWNLNKKQKRILTLKCNFGHEFQFTAKQILLGYQCPQCAEESKITIQDARKLAEEKYGLCLSPNYIKSLAPLKWLCKEGHVWSASLATVKRGHWCRVCSMQEMGVRKRKYSLRDCQLHAESKGGKCLSTNYETIKDVLRWRCALGHEWEAAPSSVLLGRKSWCRICANKAKGKSQRDTIENMQKIAGSRGGKCLSTVYKTSQEVLKWECAKGHVWSATPGNIKSGKWCPYCAGRAPLTLEQMQEIANSRGGKCLSTEYKRCKDKLEWECSKGHRWFATAQSVKGTRKQKGTWCLECHHGRRKSHSAS